VSGEHGFLPCKDPPQRLGSPYEALQELVDKMPVWLDEKTQGYLAEPDLFPRKVAELPNLVEHVEKEEDIWTVQALYRAYTFVQSALLLESAFHEYRKTHNTNRYGTARSRVPRNVAQPLCVVAAKLHVFPFLDYHYAYAACNYRRKDPAGGLEWQNLDLCCKFAGTKDEIGFIGVHIDINQYGGDLVKSIFNTLRGLAEKDPVLVTQSLKANYETMQSMNTRRRQMWEASAYKNYNDFRIFIMGTKQNDDIFGEDGICYEGVGEDGSLLPDDAPDSASRRAVYRGQTGAQDDIIPTEDIFLNIHRYYPENKLTEYLLDLRQYRPRVIQEFFADLHEGAKDIVSRLGDNVEALIFLLGSVEQVYLFRNGHWQFIIRYIMGNTKYDTATGGTPITQWVLNQIEAVLKYIQDMVVRIEKLEWNSASNARLFENIRRTLPERVGLLHGQMELLRSKNIPVERVYELNDSASLKEAE